MTIPALNDSRYIGMSVYNVVILSAIGVTVTMVLRGTIHNVLLYVLVSAVVLLSTTVTLTMVFAPKVTHHPIYEWIISNPFYCTNVKRHVQSRGMYCLCNTTFQQQINNIFLVNFRYMHDMIP